MSIVLYHGARRWDGPPRILEGRKGRTEHGPGLYLTTSLETARKYAKGGGYVMRIELEPRLGWLNDDGKRISIEEILAFLSIERLRNRKKITEDILRYASRTSRSDAPLDVLVNLMVYHNALGGSIAPLVASFLVSKGVDAALVTQNNEDWVVLFNPDKIRHATRLTDKHAVDAPLLRHKR